MKPPAKCTHHYVVETPNGTVVVHGVCRECGAERDFPTWIEAQDEWAHKIANHHKRVRTPRSAPWEGHDAIP